jgi:hypothetical protein
MITAERRLAQSLRYFSPEEVGETGIIPMGKTGFHITGCYRQKGIDFGHTRTIALQYLRTLSLSVING